MIHVLVITIMLLGASLTACNAVEGIGEDLQAGGNKIEDAADDAAN